MTVREDDTPSPASLTPAAIGQGGVATAAWGGGPPRAPGGAPASCSAGAMVLHLALTEWIEPFYWDLAPVRGLHYRVLHGDMTDAGVLAHRSGFTIDPIAVEAVLAAL
ncbi:hypothetical protein [Sphingomonas sp. BK235]|uniref:hypothetical protein n=1 Tax=Sphingomonas sp. BK235 TaxID=2512131 RepID=UPI0010521559|nr:hypothetical protein [Sphingomonas sp. BK235]TCP29685.1 hypothetical protein EV292_11636 [Sphingomonas sp. BK235]